MKLVDTCYGMTGGDLYVCPDCNSRTVTRPRARPPTCSCKDQVEASADRVRGVSGARRLTVKELREAQSYLESAASAVERGRCYRRELYEVLQILRPGLVGECAHCGVVEARVRAACGRCDELFRLDPSAHPEAPDPEVHGDLCPDCGSELRSDGEGCVACEEER